MDQSVKIAMASGVLLGGILLALLFRHDSSRTQPALPESGDRLVLRRHQAPADDRAKGQPSEGGSRGPAVREGPLGGGPKPAVVHPVAPAEPLPALAKAYPTRNTPDLDARANPPTAAARLPSVPQDPVRTHRIADGDTLQSLAQRYLGSADRYVEIFEANRNVLSSPSLLPIGVELTIPPAQTPRVPPAGQPAASLLVPIPREP